MQSPARLLYPAQCVSCREPVENDFALCGACWARTPFIAEPVCAACGAPMIGEVRVGDLCDSCLETPRPWSRGRAALVYRDNARRIVLSMKRYDRLDLVRPASRWMASAGADILAPDLLAVPVPSHWTRLIRRKANLAALLGQAVAREAGIAHAPTALVRTRLTADQEGMDRAERFANQAGSVGAHPKRGGVLAGRKVLLIDDVMTSGATLAACAEACRQAGARDVLALVLARVARDA